MIPSNVSIETIASLISLGLSVLTIAASVYAFWRYDKRINKQNILINEFTIREQKEKEEEERKAAIEVSHIYNGRGSGDLYITNVGRADARDLRMDIDEHEDSGIFWSVGDLFPYRCLTPGPIIRIHYGLMSGYQKDPILIFNWNDDFGTDRTSRHSVLLG